MAKRGDVENPIEIRRKRIKKQIASQTILVDLGQKKAQETFSKSLA